MKKIIYVTLTILFLCAISNAFAGQKSSDQEHPHVPGRILIKLKSEYPTIKGEQLQAATQVRQLLQQINAVSDELLFFNIYPTANHKKVAEEVGLDRWLIVTVPIVTNIEQLAKQLRADPRVEIAEPDYLLSIDAVPNDPFYPNQRHLPQIKAPQAWDIQKGDSTVIIAVIDTGVDWDHPDLTAVIWNNSREIPDNGIDDDRNGYIDDIRGWDFVSGVTGGTGTTDPDPGDDLNNEDNNPMDYQGHGTHVAGIIGAATNNSVGVASVSWGCKIMPLRIGFRTNNGSGTGYSTWMSRAFRYAADNGATVANLSFGSSSPVLDGALYAYRNGVVICKSAGNSNNENQDALTNQPWVLKVASVNDIDQKASYSSYGSWVNISAPGGDFSSGARVGIWSTVVHPSAFYSGNQYAEFQGTSMASPVVAGLVGLVKSRFPSMNAASLMFQIAATADNIDDINPAFRGKLGFGRLNAERAVTQVAPAMKPILSIYSFSLNDALGNNNGIIEPGETIELTVSLKNEWENATNVFATLTADDWGINITKSNANYGTIVGIRDLDNNIKSNSSDRFVFTVHPDSIPRSVNFKITVTANQGYVKVFDLNTSILGSVLFVDDDDGTVNVEDYYTSTFKNIGLIYDTWNRYTNGPITSSRLSAYKTVIWGCEWAFPSLDQDDRNAITVFLNNGGNLLLAGQDIAWDLCDPEGTEYYASSGASKSWFENYFKAQYVNDNASTTSIIGLTGDPIGDGLTFTFTEPLRTSTQQFPDVVSVLTGGSPVFRYPNSTIAAVRSSSTYKTVFIGFGGLEAITDIKIRTTVIDRVYNWFNGFKLDHTPLKDTEFSDSRKVEVKITSLANVESVNLYWDIDGAFPFNKIIMQNKGGGWFEGYIPGQSNATVQYTIIVKTANGFMPYQMYEYKVGVDNTPPTFLAVDSLENTLSKSGLYSVSLTADDNFMLDTSSTYVFFKINNSLLDSVKLSPLSLTKFIGSFSVNHLVPQLKARDSIFYFYQIQDGSSRRNRARYPATGFRAFVIGRQFIDDFEKVRPIWNYGTSWGYEKSIRSSIETNVISDSPGGNYAPNSDNALTLTLPLDLSAYSYGRFYFWRSMSIHSSDTLYIEYKNETSNWITIRKMNGSFPPGWRKDSVDIPGSSSSTLFRFRLWANEVNETNGILLDDLEIVSNEILTSVDDNIKYSPIPTNVSLSQNYPNPFNPATTIEYQLPSDGYVEIEVFDILGRQIAILAKGFHKAGTHKISFEAHNLPSGIYFYRMKAGQYTNVRKMILIR